MNNEAFFVLVLYNLIGLPILLIIIAGIFFLISRSSRQTPDLNTNDEQLPQGFTTKPALQIGYAIVIGLVLLLCNMFTHLLYRYIFGEENNFYNFLGIFLQTALLFLPGAFLAYLYTKQSFTYAEYTYGITVLLIAYMDAFLSTSGIGRYNSNFQDFQNFFLLVWAFAPILFFPLVSFFTFQLAKTKTPKVLLGGTTGILILVILCNWFLYRDIPNRPFNVDYATLRAAQETDLVLYAPKNYMGALQLSSIHANLKRKNSTPVYTLYFYPSTNYRNSNNGIIVDIVKRPSSFTPPMSCDESGRPCEVAFITPKGKTVFVRKGAQVYSGKNSYISMRYFLPLGDELLTFLDTIPPQIQTDLIQFVDSLEPITGKELDTLLKKYANPGW